MPKLPRNLTGLELCKRLAKFGYKQTRQTGSHIRVTRISDEAEHHVTIPAHDPIKIGTLNAILTDIANHLGIAKNELL
jgi:predicted RNA binding protein YcfA (HicA-like mRNA interferase family)